MNPLCGNFTDVFKNKPPAGIDQPEGGYIYCYLPLTREITEIPILRNSY